MNDRHIKIEKIVDILYKSAIIIGLLIVLFACILLGYCYFQLNDFIGVLLSVIFSMGILLFLEKIIKI